VDYLLKPVSDERLARCVERLKQKCAAAPDEMWRALQQLLATPAKPQALRWLRVQVGQTVRMVAVDEVCYFNPPTNIRRCITRDAELLLRTPLKNYSRNSIRNNLWQVHRIRGEVNQIVTAQT